MPQHNNKPSQTLFLQYLLLGVVIYIAGSLVMLGGIALIPADRLSTRSRASSDTLQFASDGVAVPSEIVESGEVLQGTVFSEAQEDPLMVIEGKKGAGAVMAFMDSLERTEVPASTLVVESQVQGVNSAQIEPETTVLPEGFSDTAKLVKVIDEKKDLGHIGIANAKHYYYQQYLTSKGKNIPLYASSARFDTLEESGSSKLQGVGVSIAQNTTVVSGSITSEEAVSLARQEAVKGDFPSGLAPTKCAATSVQEIVFNKRLMNISDDDTNYAAYLVSLCNEGEVTFIANDYIIARADGTLIHTEPQILTAINRRIDNFVGGRWQMAVRSEGAAPTGNADIDKAYDLLGKVYNYYKDNHGRDSYDGRGGKLAAGVNFTGVDVNGQFLSECPNAFWFIRQMYACKGFVEADVWGHEITHGVIQTVAGLGNTNQAGALNEAYADIFSWGVSPDDWRLGSIRRMDDPTKSASPRGGQPDRISSQKFKCFQGQQPTKANDQGGVHSNNGVVAKAFYLMVEGGSFNGCTIRGNDPKKVLDVMYKSMTYLSPTSTLKDAYVAVTRACDQVLGAGTECQNIKMAMQATEMDQTMGAQCRVGAPTCAGQTGGGSNPVPTSSPTSGPTSRPTQPLPTQRIPTRTITTASPTQQATRIPTRIPTKGNIPNIITQSPTKPGTTNTGGGPATTQISPVVPDSPGTPTTPDDPSTDSGQDAPNDGSAPEGAPKSESVLVKLSTKFQGIKSIPTTPRNTMIVKVSLLGGPTKASVAQLVSFTAGPGGIWTGEASFDVAPGNYVAFIKGTHHIQRKLCELTSIETAPGTYKCNNNTFPLISGINTLDFSRIDQLTCDISVNGAGQNGVCNGQDIGYIRNNMGSSDPSRIDPCDVNRDGVCNAQDYALVLQALVVKNDEE